jgi:DNA-binding CsgD family transcriptional regulator
MISEAIQLTRLSAEELEIRVPSEASLASRASNLTNAERAVIALAISGMSNDAIAARRRSSTRTVAKQLATAYQKLGLSGRRELRAGLLGQRTR